MRSKGLQKRKLVLVELEKSLGIVTVACKNANCSRTEFYKWYNEIEDFKKEVDNITEQTIDFAENSLLKQIKAGDTTATIFYLKTKGRSRGYVEKVDVNNTGTIVQVIVDNEDLKA